MYVVHSESIKLLGKHFGTDETSYKVNWEEQTVQTYLLEEFKA